MERLGDEDWIVQTARKYPAQGLAFFARMAPLQVRVEQASVTIVVHQVALDPRPIPGVIASPIAEHVWHPEQAQLVLDEEDGDAAQG